MTELFVEQPLASPGSVKNRVSDMGDKWSEKKTESKNFLDSVFSSFEKKQSPRNSSALSSSRRLAVCLSVCLSGGVCEKVTCRVSNGN